MMARDNYWDNVDECAQKIRSTRTVEEALTVFNEHFEPSSGDAFYGGSGGDNQVLDMLTEAGWTIVWMQAQYYFVARDLNGDLMTYVEGDLYRGDRR